MKIKTKLLLGFSIKPVLIIFLVILGWAQLSGISRTNDALTKNYESAFLAKQIQVDIKNEVIILRNLLIMDKDQLQEQINALKAESETISNEIMLLEASTNEIEQRSAIEGLKNINHRFNAYKNTVIELVSQNKQEEAIQLINSTGNPLQDEFFQTISGITDTFEEEMSSSLEGLSSNSHRQIIAGSLLSILIIIFGVIFVFRIVWAIVVRLNKVSNVMVNVAHGRADLNTRIDVLANDEIDDVARSFNMMAESLEEKVGREQDRNWITSNIAEITTALTGSHDLEGLAGAFLSKAAPLTGACYAAFYMKEDQDGERVLKLLSSYADRNREREPISSTFRFGESIVGQAALENSPICLTDVPSDYIRIQSALGEAVPMNVYAWPVGYEGDVKAVVEIASFKAVTPIQINFLTEMIGYLGIILDGVMGRVRLANLLEETQMLMEELQAQSEELQSQQEELRVTNEELEEQTQALRQSEEKLQLQQEELEQTNSVLKEKAEHLEIQNRRSEATNREMARARVELEEKARQLAMSSKYKSEFLANMSHELRTPLNSLLILSKLLSENHEKNLTNKQVEFAKTIFSSGSDLLTLINDILDLAKVESGMMEVHPANVLITDLIEFVEKSFRPIANEKKLGFSIHVQDGLPLTIHSDEQRLQQVLKNLLSNAFKFTHQGEVKLEVSKGEAPGGKQELIFSIADTGIGIPKDKQELIFQAFQQADGTTSRKYGGTGLGLSICREISAILGGKIEVMSEESKWSIFCFRIGDYQSKGEELQPEAPVVSAEAIAMPAPIAKEAPSAESTPAIPAGGIKRLLIVDQDLKQRNSLMELIGDKQIIITAVSTGAQAMEELKVNDYDCMILDVSLPDTTGFELLERINTDRVTIFIHTGRELTSKEEIHLRKYTHTIIIKNSLSHQRLKDELDLYLNSVGETGGDHAAADKLEIDRSNDPSGLKGKRILLVDDDVRNVFALSSVLEIHGMEVAFAENGREALELLLANDPSFDLVLMDIMMPEMDGYQAMQKIRSMAEFQKLPIIALTAKAMKEDREKCINAGASDYIAKPVNPEQLISLIKVWLYQGKVN